VFPIGKLFNYGTLAEVVHILPEPEPVRKPVIDDVLKNGHVVMVIGRVDTGKSTFCRQLALSALGRGLTVAIVDSDVGQSWIGPPTTVGMKIVTGEPSPTLFPDSFYFVGSVTPEKHLLQTIVGAKRMVESAEKANADLIIIDTTGFVDRSIGRALKLSKIDLIKPDHIICFQRASELETLIRGVGSDVCRVHRLEPSKSLEKKTSDFRVRYRNEQFNGYFSDSKAQELQFSQLKGQRDIFLNGRRANEKELDNITQILDCEAIYAEWSFRGLFVVTAHKFEWLASRRLCSQLKIEELYARIPEDFVHLLVALIDSQGEPICLALIESTDFNNGIMNVRCRDGAARSAKTIQFSDFHI
jgi:polynucleotide 5'-hydroxyl-kinase GRC3/NOL9